MVAVDTDLFETKDILNIIWSDPIAKMLLFIMLSGY